MLSWLLLRGRCRHCGEPISARYPLVEALTAALCVAVVLAEGADSDVWLGLAFVLLLIPITFIDLDHRIIPNVLTGLGAVVALVLVAVFQTDDLVEHLIAAVAAGGFLLVAAIAYPAGMGMGDVKLAGVMGLFLGRAVGPAMLRRADRRLARRDRRDAPPRAQGGRAVRAVPRARRRRRPVRRRRARRPGISTPSPRAPPPGGGVGVFTPPKGRPPGCR